MYLSGKASAAAALESFLERAGSDYAARRNYDLGPGRHAGVSCLSPWVRTRLLPEWEVVRRVANTHGVERASKFIDEVCWRTYWKGWLQLRPEVWDRYLEELAQVHEASEFKELCQNVLAGRSGIECLDAWTKELKETGYLHNHARMWYASIWVHTLGLPWVLGAEFFLQHLLDGDAASNTLSWRWVAGLHTAGKTYLAQAENIRNYTEGRFEVSTSLAKSARVVDAEPLPPARELPKLESPKPGQRLGWLIQEDDLSGSAEMALPSAPVAIAGLIPRAAYKKFGIAESVTTFRRESLKDILPEGAQCFETVAGGVAWAVAEELDGVVISEVPIGLWNESLVALENTLRENGIALYQLRSDWDAKLHPHARAGFFRFKKAIPEAVRSIVTPS